MDLNERVREIIEPTAQALGFDLVRVTYGGGRTPTLQIMAERPDGTMAIEDCEALSREVSALLDVEDPIAGEYNLEVSSPGIDRPLTRAKDFQRWQGFDAKLELDEAQDGRRRFSGVLGGMDGEEVLIETQEGPARVPLSRVVKAKLILTDALIEAAGDPHRRPEGVT